MKKETPTCIRCGKRNPYLAYWTTTWGPLCDAHFFSVGHGLFDKLRARWFSDATRHPKGIEEWAKQL